MYVALTAKKGRGVFAAKDIDRHETIEICPVIVFPAPEIPHMNQTYLYNYYFSWGELRDAGAIVLGYGMLYNHAYQPNARYLKHFARQELEIVALTDIPKDTEITINYNGHPTKQKTVWFKAVD